MKESFMMPLATVPSSATNEPGLDLANAGTSAKAQQMELALPNEYSRDQKASDGALNPTILLPALPNAYQGSSPRKYKLNQARSDIGAAPVSPIVLAFHSKQFPTAATERVGKSKQRSTIPSVPTSAVSTLSHFTQVSQSPPQQTMHTETANMIELVEIEEQEGLLGPLPPQALIQDEVALDEVDTEATQKNLTSEQPTTDQLMPMLCREGDQSSASQDCVLVPKHFVQMFQQHYNEQMNVNNNISDLLDDLEQQSQLAVAMRPNPQDHDLLPGSSPPEAASPPGRFDGSTDHLPSTVLTDASAEAFTPIQNGRKRMAVPLKTGQNKATTPNNRANKSRVPPKKLSIHVAGNIHTGYTAPGMPTPLTAVPTTGALTGISDVFPNTPGFGNEPGAALATATTPATDIKLVGRIGPPVIRRQTTAINKRGFHDLAKSIPPSHVLIPLLPLTDTEIVVYFFNALTRPVVSLRLYGRHWGPAAIVQVLNEHREIQPPYLRNTCSVKCTTALKNGRDMFGPEWETNHQAVFVAADDFKATDMIRHKDDEVTMDYELRSLCLNLKKHPGEEESGIFTRCVQYCEETQATYTLANAHKLAADLLAGRVPMYAPASVLDHADPGSKRKRDGGDSGDGEEEDDNEEEDGEYSTPTPVKNIGAVDLVAAYSNV